MKNISSFFGAFFISARSVAVVILLLLIGCKASRISQSNSTDPDTVTIIPVPIEQPTVYHITSTGDTIDSLDESIDISVSDVHQKSISIAAVGDIMMGTNFPNSSYLAENTRLLWEQVSQTLITPDVTFGNLEGVILTEGGEQKECRNPKNCFLFRTPDSLATLLRVHGFDLISMANNHANDFGITGRLNTQRVLDSLGIIHAGSLERPFDILRTKGYTIGLVAFAPNKGTLSLHDTATARRYVQMLDSIVDIVAVSFHAGAEGAKNEHISRQREFYFGEDRGNVYEFAHDLIDAGADVILGHGPHVVRAIEIYNKRLIAYSLGNFLTYRRFNLQGPNALAPVLEIRVNINGEFLDGKIHSFVQDYELGTIRDFRHRAFLKIRDLTLSDFSENQINFTEDGTINYISN